MTPLAEIYKKHKSLLMDDTKLVSNDKQYRRGYKHGANQRRRDIIKTIKKYGTK